MRFFIIFANNNWKYSVSTFNLRKISKLNYIFESFKEEIPNNFQTFSKNHQFEDTSSKTSKETPYIYIQSIRIILEIQNSNFQNNFGKSVMPKFSQNSYKVWKKSIFSSVTNSVWTVSHTISYFAQQLYDKYKVGYRICQCKAKN